MTLIWFAAGVAVGLAWAACGLSMMKCWADTTDSNEERCYRLAVVKTAELLMLIGPFVVMFVLAKLLVGGGKR